MDAIKLTETYYNTDVIRTLLKVNTEHPDYNHEIMMWKSEQDKLKNVLAKSKDGKNVVEYSLKKYGVGRLYPTPFKNSYQSMYNTIRRLVIDGNCTSVDLVNAHPTILKQLINQHANLEFRNLAKYVNDREGVRQDIMKKYNVSKSQVKDLFIRMIFGGSYKTWFEENKIKKEPCKFIYELFEELTHISTVTSKTYFPNYQRFEDIAKQKKGEKDEFGCIRTAMALYLQDQERIVISHLYKYLESKGLKVCALIHDELLVEGDVQIDLDEAAQYIKQHANFTIQLESKATKPSAEDLEWFESHKQFITDNDFKTYEEIKVEFEKQNFKLIDSSEYATFKNGFLIRRKKTDFKEAFCEMTYTKEVINKKGDYQRKTCKFIDEWFDDASKRSYDKVDFIPPPLTCPPNVFNLWNGLPYDDMECGEVKEEDATEIIYLIQVLCNHHEETIEYVLNWMANIVQSPGKKSRTALVFKSKQGAGKNSLIEIFKKLLSNKYVGETSNPNVDLFGAHGNIHIGKLLCSLDEVCNKDTNQVLGRLKSLITSDTCTYNEKGLKITETYNHTRFIFTTNSSIPISLDSHDRRYCLIESSNELCKQKNFWDDFYKNVINNDTKLKAFYQLLKNRDISQVNYEAFPKTELRDEIIGASLHPIIFWMDEFLQSERFNNKDVVKMTSTELLKEYYIYCELRNIKIGSLNAKAFGIQFKDHLDFEKTKIDKIKSMGMMKYSINKHDVFKWLKENQYSSYDTLPGVSQFIKDDE